MAPAQSLLELEALAREKLPPQIFDFIAGAAEDEITLARNRQAWQAIQLLPRVLVDVSTVDTSTTVLGQKMPSPVVLAPVALHRLVHDDGELATARAAAAQGATMTLSTMASCTIEDVAAAADGPKWFQLYCYTDRAVTERLVGRAEAAGYSALCLTVDVPCLGRRERDELHRHAVLLGQLHDQWGQPTAGGAPLGPEIDQDRSVRVQHFLLERRLGYIKNLRHAAPPRSFGRQHTACCARLHRVG